MAVSFINLIPPKIDFIIIFKKLYCQNFLFIPHILYLLLEYSNSFLVLLYFCLKLNNNRIISESSLLKVFLVNYLHSMLHFPLILSVLLILFSLNINFFVFIFFNLTLLVKKRSFERIDRILELFLLSLTEGMVL